MTKENTTACYNNICIKNKECERYRLFKSGVNAKANSGDEKKGCLKFLPLSQSNQETE